MTYLNEEFRHVTVHELYREFAEWHIAQGSEEDANKAKCLYYIGGERLPRILTKGRAGKCWEELSRVFLSGLRVLKTLPPRSNEWPNVVVLQLKRCPDLTSLNLQGMESLRHLTVEFCRKLEKIEVSVEEQCLRDLRYLQLKANHVLKSIPRIWGCAELVEASISNCPKLEYLFIHWACWTGIANIVLTQNLQRLSISGRAQGHVADAALLKSVCKRDVQGRWLNETSCPVLNKVPHEAQYGSNLRALHLSDLYLQDFNLLSTLSGLQELHLDEVHLTDEGTLCLEGCAHLKRLTIEGGNVHTVTGIGKMCEFVTLYSMENLQYTDLEPRIGRVICIIDCERYEKDARRLGILYSAQNVKGARRLRTHMQVCRGRKYEKGLLRMIWRLQTWQFVPWQRSTR